MRCDECQIEPLTPGHYCECCGRKLSLQERKALEAFMAGTYPEPAPVEAPVAAAAPEFRCDSCGAATEASGLCPNCQHAFHTLLESKTLTSPVPDPLSAPTAVEASAAEASPSEPSATELERPDVSSVQTLSDFFTTLSATSVADVAPAEPAVPQPTAAPPLAAQSVTQDAAAPEFVVAAAPAIVEPVKCEPVHVDPVEPLAPVEAVPFKLEAEPIKIKVRPEPAREVVEEAPAPMTCAANEQVAEAPAIAEPVKASPRPRAAANSVPLPVASVPAPAGRGRSVAITAAAVVVVGAIGFPIGQHFFGRQQLLTEPRHETPKAAAAAPKPAVAEHSAAAIPTLPPVSAAESLTPAPVAPAVQTEKAPPVRTASAVQKPVTAASKTVPPPARLPSKPTARQTKPLAPPPVAVAVAAPQPAVVEAPPPPAPVAAPEPAAAVPAGPTAPFYEVRDVNEGPKVVSRIEPKVPAELQNQSVKEILIVRVLVSQTGQPSFVSLLRRSKSGLPLDEAVIAAVKRWSFSPAKKRGEPVSCWYNLGVQVNAGE